MKFVLFADVYGFSAMVKENMTSTNESLKAFHADVERLLKQKISLPALSRARGWFFKWFR